MFKQGLKKVKLHVDADPKESGITIKLKNLQKMDVNRRIEDPQHKKDFVKMFRDPGDGNFEEDNFVSNLLEAVEMDYATRYLSQMFITPSE